MVTNNVTVYQFEVGLDEVFADEVIQADYVSSSSSGKVQLQKSEDKRTALLAGM